jgi:transcriptional regulator with XRE-family HTH domain
MATFGERLKALRDARGVSEAKLAAASSVTFGAIHDYGLGRRKPSFAAVVKIATALGVTCEAFADCEDVQQDRPAPKRRSARSANKLKSPRLRKER